MFAIFLHESMNQFHQVATSFPTAIFTVLMIVCMCYWLIAVLGLVDLEILDIDLDGDTNTTDSLDAHHGIAGVLLKFGLNGVPLTIVITFISIFGWMVCYFSTVFIENVTHQVLPGLVYKPIIFIVGSFASIMITAQAIKPIRVLFKKLYVDETKHIVGQVVTVRSTKVTHETGEAFMNDGAAGVLLNIRSSSSEEVFYKGDEVVVIEEINNNNLYRVISKLEFSGE